MVKCDKKRIEQDIVICLQLEDGTRLNGNYQPTKILLDIITEMCPEKSSPDQSPIIIYMRTEIFGDKLNSTTLKSLGLTSGGRALLRLINSDPQNLKVQANVSAPVPRKPKKEEENEEPRKKLNEEKPSSSKAFEFQNVQQLKQELKKDEKPEEEKMEVEESINEEKPIETVQEEPISESDVEIKAVQQHPVINILDDRGTIIFSLDSIQTSSMDLPDSFFELTETDVRLLYRELRNQVENMENAPLLTAEYRKLEENKKILNQLSTYKSCAIRIQLPNRHVIQSKFSTVVTVGFVMEFLKQFLVDPSVEFYLYQTPPKTIINRDLTLIEANCVPSALLHFGCDKDFDEFLKPEYYEKLSSGFGVSSVLLTPSSASQPKTEQPSESATSSHSAPKKFMESKVNSKPSGTVPKWFKPNK